MRKIFCVLMCLSLAVMLAAGCAPQPSAPEAPEPVSTPEPAAPAAPEPEETKGYTPGTYEATIAAMHGPMTVEVTVSEDAITDVKVTAQMETPGIGDIAAEQIPMSIVEYQSLAVDTVSGVTISSNAVLRGAEECLVQAGADISLLKTALPKTTPADITEEADVIIVGGGGAGLSAAVAATKEGASVILIEKMGFLGGNSIVAGGIYNAPDASLQDNGYQKERSESLETLITSAISEEPVNDEHKELMAAVKKEYDEYLKSDKTLFDSPNWFALQTWNGGDKIAVLSIVKILAGQSFDALQWLESMGMEFIQQISHGGGSLYPRTHTAVLPNGSGYIKAFVDTLEGSANYTQLMNTEATGLIVEGDKVVGVNAVGKDGNKVTLKANNGVILATGGFAGNVELRQEYCEGEKWPDLSAKVPTSNMPGVTGDGIFFARDAGAQLVNMDQIQLLPYCNPTTGATYDIVVGSGGGVFINKEGKRFVREDGRRDEMSNGIIAQTDGMMYLLYGLDKPAEETFALGGQNLAYYLETNYGGYVMADTIAELAEKLNVPVDVMVQTIEEYNSYVESGKADPFGRVSYSGKLDAGPFFAFPRKPAVHHTMGGVLIDENCRALREDGTPVKGLYCAGEITGVVHGGNRLGGNAIVDFTVFGRIAGTAAAKGE